MSRRPRSRRVLYTCVFATGVILACCFAARPAPGAGSAAPVARLVAWFRAAGLPFSAGVALLLSGALLLRVRRGRSRADDAVAAEHFASSQAVLQTVQRKLALLKTCEPLRQARRMRELLDEILEDDVPGWLEFRPELLAELGPSRYAVLVGHFARVERYAARAWSALADRAHSEVGPSLQQAELGIEQAIAALAAARRGSAGVARSEAGPARSGRDP